MTLEEFKQKKNPQTIQEKIENQLQQLENLSDYVNPNCIDHELETVSKILSECYEIMLSKKEEVFQRVVREHMK